MTMTNDDQIILQSYYTVVLLKELDSNNFLESDFFRNMKFDWPDVKTGVREIGVTNKGAKLMALHAMLMIPKELLFSKYSNEFCDVDKYLDSVCINTETNYRSDREKVSFVRHLRNALAHTDIDFESGNTMKFSDKNTRKNGGKVLFRTP